jgi:hypothetical protein
VAPLFPNLENCIAFSQPIYSRDFQTFGRLYTGVYSRTLGTRMHLLQVVEPSLQRRSAVRYKLRLPVIFHWNDGTEHTEGGFTNDVSLDGALIFSAHCPPYGTAIRIELLIPSPDESGEDLRIECIGKVTRVAQQTGCFGVQGMFDDDHLTRNVSM